MEQIQMVQVEDLHPHEKNPRIDAASVADLVESIREHGIEVPLVAAPQLGADGYVVLAGHRRLTAAHEVALAKVPVQIREDLADTRTQLAFMATENLHRDQLTAVEESRLVQDMLNLGMSQAEVAKQTALGKKRVSERVKIGKLAEQTGEKVHRGQITVDQALVIAEYSDDAEIAVQLEDAAGTYSFDIYTSRAKARREMRQLKEEAEKLAKKEGLRISEGMADFVRLSELVEEGYLPAPDADLDDAEAWNRALMESHKDCPGHSAELPDTLGSRELVVGCDQVAVQHDTPSSVEGPAEAEREPEPDPLDRFTIEDLQTMRYDRESKVHTALTTTDLSDWVRNDLTERALAVFDRLDSIGDGYRQAALGFLGLPPDATDASVSKAVKKLPWASQYVFVNLARPALFHHVPMSGSARAWMWTGTQTNHVDELFRAVGADPSDLEKELRTLRDNPWDKPTNEDTDDAVEGGEAA